LSEAVENLLGFESEKLYEDVVLVFEIQINGTVGHPRLPGDLGDGGLIETLPGEHFHGRFQYAVVLVFGFCPGVDKPPP
jgi:hypothetical protein